jgi:hypothetical protein
VSDVSEHDGEEEGEGDDGEESRVDLLVRGDSVRVDNGLESSRELVRAVERGRVLGAAKLVEDGGDASTRVLLEAGTASAGTTEVGVHGDTHRCLPE